MRGIKQLRCLVLVVCAGTIGLSGVEAAESERFRKPSHLVYIDQSIEYDSNVLSNVDEAQTDQSDIVFGTTTLIDLPVVRPGNDFDVHLSYLFLQFLHDDFDELDFRYQAPEVSVWFLAGPKWASTIRFGYVFTQEDNREFYNGIQTEVEFQRAMSDASSLSLAYRINQQDYKQEIYEERDAWKHRLQAKWQQNWIPDKSAWSVTGRAEFNDADNDGYSYAGVEVEAGLDLYALPGKFDWNFSAGFRYRNYDEIYPGESEARDDERFNVTAEVSHPLFWDSMYVSVTVEYLKNFSNLDLFEYDETIVGGHLSFIF